MKKFLLLILLSAMVFLNPNVYAQVRPGLEDDPPPDPYSDCRNQAFTPCTNAACGLSTENGTCYPASLRPPPGYCFTGHTWFEKVNCPNGTSEAEETIQCGQIEPCPIAYIYKKIGHIFDGKPLTDADKKNLDDDKDGDVDIDDLLKEIRALYFVSSPRSILLAGYLRDANKAFLRGDVNGDKLVNTNDTTYFSKWYANKTNPAPTCMKAADINDDGKVDAQDNSEFLLRVTTGNIPAPFTSAAKDPTPDDLTCGQSIASLLTTTTTTTTTTVPPPSTTRPPGY